MSCPKFPDVWDEHTEHLVLAYFMDEITYLGTKEVDHTDTMRHPRPGSVQVLRTVVRSLYFQPTEEFPANTPVKFDTQSLHVPVHAYTYTQSNWVDP